MSNVLINNETEAQMITASWQQNGFEFYGKATMPSFDPMEVDEDTYPFCPYCKADGTFVAIWAKEHTYAHFNRCFDCGSMWYEVYESEGQMSTKKHSPENNPPPIQIDIDRFGGDPDLSTSTCSHSVFDTFGFKTYDDGWQYAHCICKVCAHQWDAWSAPGVQTVSRKSWLALVNGAPLPASEGDNE